MKKKVIHFVQYALIKILFFGAVYPLHAQISNPSSWESFVGSDENRLVSDTFRLQTFGDSEWDNWEYTTSGATQIQDISSVMELVQARRIGFAGAIRRFALDAIEEAGQKRLDDLLRRTVELVGKDRELDAALLQLPERPLDAGIGPCELVPVFGIEPLPALGRLLHGVVRRLGGNGEADERLHAAADETQDLVVRPLGIAARAQRRVGELDQIGKRVEQRAVQIEHDRIDGALPGGGIT